MPFRQHVHTTYSRHRKRVVTLDPFDEEPATNRVFSSNSEDSGLQNDSGDHARKPPSGKQKKAKENVDPFACRPNHSNIFDSSSTDQSHSSPAALPPPARRTTRKCQNTKQSAASKTTRKGKNTSTEVSTPDVSNHRTTRVLRSTCKKTSKKPAKSSRIPLHNTRVLSDSSSSQDSHSSMNFSEFDKYSLIVDEESPVGQNTVPSSPHAIENNSPTAAGTVLDVAPPATPHIESNVPCADPPPSAFTSTPHHAHLARIESPLTVPNFSESAVDVSNLADDSVMKQCRIELEKLSVADVSGIAASPSLGHTAHTPKLGKSPFLILDRLSLKPGDSVRQVSPSPYALRHGSRHKGLLSANRSQTPNTSRNSKAEDVTPYSLRVNNSQHVTARRGASRQGNKDVLTDSRKGGSSFLSAYDASQSLFETANESIHASVEAEPKTDSSDTTEEEVDDDLSDIKEESDEEEHCKHEEVHGDSKEEVEEAYGEETDLYEVEDVKEEEEGENKGEEDDEIDEEEDNEEEEDEVTDNEETEDENVTRYTLADSVHIDLTNTNSEASDEDNDDGEENEDASEDTEKENEDTCEEEENEATEEQDVIGSTDRLSSEETTTNTDKSQHGHELSHSPIDDLNFSHLSVHDVSKNMLDHKKKRKSLRRKTIEFMAVSTKSAVHTPKREQRGSRLDTLRRETMGFKETLTPVKSPIPGQTMTPREKVLLHCDQEAPVSFADILSPTMLKKCVKIGEGVYGEVFKTERNRESVALKVIPIEGDFPVNDEPQKTFEEMLSEIVISKELSDLRFNPENSTQNFVQVKRVSVVQDSYHPVLLEQWDAFAKRKGTENDRPDNFPKTQLYIVFEFEECGCDLEAFKFQSMTEARAVLTQVAVALAVAERALQFEHRDLHWGNVLVKRLNDTNTTAEYCMEGVPFSIHTEGLHVAIIDFTLSRLSKDGCSVFCDLSTDPTLFEGQGDYQFDIYRLMKEENRNSWKEYRPYTNVLWLHYLADKLTKATKYPDTRSKEYRSMSRHFRTFLREALDYQSAGHFFSESTFFNDI